jgi:hydrogenase-4 component E
MHDALFTQLLATTTGLLLVTAILQVWRQSLPASIRLLAVQGAALAGLVAILGIREGSSEVLAVALLVLGMKAAAIPWALSRTASATGAIREESPLVNPTAGLLAATALTVLAFVVGLPIVAVLEVPGASAVPVGLALVLIGFLVMLTRRSALSQLIGFVILDNGIATTAFLTSGGVPLVVELGVTLDVLLVVLILRVLTSRIQSAHGGIDLDDLTELRD